mmetsp:Transcript_14746/g.42226  ORF Transcript_14746/g.42226 Transcript_14746/m.42226 type:complete len:261 (-) Transcript_14746:8-790(-)
MGWHTAPQPCRHPPCPLQSFPRGPGQGQGLAWAYAAVAARRTLPPQYFGILRPATASCQAAGSDRPEGAPPQGGAGKGKEEENVLQSGPARYIPYIARTKMLLLRAKQAVVSGSRYVAYSSDVGESLRPVLKPWMVNLTYGIAGAYIVGDTALSGYLKYSAGHSSEVVAATVAHTATFQVGASLALPALIIHTAVHQAQNVLRRPTFSAMPRLAQYGPSGLGLAIIPLLPLLDPPVEAAIDAVFDRAWPAWRVGHHEHGH